MDINDERKAGKAESVAECSPRPPIGAGKVARCQLASSNLMQQATSRAFKSAASSSVSLSVALKHGPARKSYIIRGCPSDD